MMRSLLAVLSLALVCSGCGGGSSGSNDAFLRVYHASADAPNVDVLVDGVVVLSDVPYGTASAYLTVDAGERRIEVRAAGTDVTVIDAVLNLTEDSSSTVIAANLVASLEAIVTNDARSVSEAGMSMVRVAHLAPSAPAVDVYATAPDASLDGETPVLSNVPFGAVSDYLVVPAGEYQFRVTVAGTTTVAIDSGSVAVNEGDVVTAAALDATGGGAPFSLALLSDR